MSQDNDNEVGYKRPPKHTRFKKGKSGNPRGRPRKQRPAEGLAGAVEQALERRVTITLDGRRVSVTASEALAHQLVAKAISGDTRVALQLLRQLNDNKTNATALSEPDADEDLRPAEDEIIERYLARQGFARPSLSTAGDDGGDHE